MCPATARGFTLVELLLVVVLLAILAAITMPSVNALDDDRLRVAGSEVRDAMRLARAEAMRRGKPVLLDAESSAGHVRLWLKTCTSYGSTTVADPRTKSAFDIDISGGGLTHGVTMTPRFLASGVAYGGLVFGADGQAIDVCQISNFNGQGTPEAGSGVQLSLGGRQMSVTVDAATGRVVGP